MHVSMSNELCNQYLCCGTLHVCWPCVLHFTAKQSNGLQKWVPLLAMRSVVVYHL